MIDVTRWVLTEAWIANGLRIEWGGYGSATVAGRGEGWQPADKGDAGAFRYRGWGVWEVAGESRTGLGYTRPEAPTLGTDTMLHELGHWLVATAEQRDKLNFGMEAEGEAERELEERTLVAQKVLESVCASASRVTQLALAGRP